MPVESVERTQTNRKKPAARFDKTRGEKGGEEQLKVLKGDKTQSKNNETKQANFSLWGTLKTLIS